MLIAHFCQKGRANHAFHDTNNTGCNELLVVLLLEHNAKFRVVIIRFANQESEYTVLVTLFARLLS